MTIPRLAKISPPRLYDVAPRARLFAALDGALGFPSVWLHGAPGAGKTTLAASFIDERRIEARWLHVDSGDADPASLFQYLALLAPDGTALPAYGTEYASHLQAFARRFFRALFASLPEGVMLVLDNVHEAAASTDFMDALLAAIHEVPPGVHLLIVSRAAPPAVCARLLASRRLAQVGGQALMLAVDEVAAIAGLDSGDSGAAAGLRAGCGGWAAGLTLILARRDALCGTPAAIKGGEAAMFDFLATEVFAQADARLQKFLLHVWPLPRITVEAAQALSGEAAAELLLEDLYRRNYFTECFFEPQPSYRFHALFREFLAAQSRRLLDGDARASLLRAAAAQLEGEGDLLAAVTLLHEAGETGAMGETVLRAAAGLIAAGRAETLRSAIERLPAPQRDATPALNYWLGMASLARAPASARLAFERAWQPDAVAHHPLFAARVVAGVINSTYSEWSDFSLLDPWLERMDRLLPPALAAAEPAEALQLLAAALVGNLYRRPTHAELPRLALKVQDLLGAPVAPDLRVKAGTFLLNYWNWVGDFGHAQTTIAALAPLIGDAQVSPFHRAWYWLRRAYHDYLAAEFAALDTALSLARDIAAVENFAVVDTIASLYAAFGQLAQGNLEAGGATLAALAARIEPSRRLDRAIHNYLCGWHRLACGEAQTALEHAGVAADLAAQAGVENVAVYFGLLQALAEARSGAPQAGWERYQSLLAGGAEQDYPIMAFEAATIGAELAARCGLGDEAAALTARAMSLGGRHELFNSLLWLPDQAAATAARALRAQVEPAYVQRLIARRALTPGPDAPPEWPWPLRLRCFGPFEIEVRGTPLRFQRKAQKRPLMLLMALVAAGGQAVSGANLAEQLWPEAEGDAARGALATTMFRLRHLLGEPDALILREGKLWLDRSRVWVDVWQFEQLAAAIEEGRDDAGASARQLLACYRGPFLGQEEDAPWMLPARARLRTHFLRSIEQLGGRFESAGAWAQAADLYARGVEADPLAEALYRRWMNVLREQGRRAEAIEVYRRCRHVLSVVLGIAPAADTERLRRQLD
ncbi:MAG: hypothetical protein KF778_20940 [Rhodocyclaceae bacterium]|nr:hypothetical protein [Rhodocyclaceae bacterium]